MEIKKLISFDFDDTLVHTTLPAEGKIIWKEKTGEEWPYRAWWSKPESLDMEVFDIPLNKKIYRRYKQAISDPDNYVILATGRVAPLKDEVDIILNHYGLEFDEMHLNPGIDTFEFKSNLFAKLINELQPEEFIMYDDRQEHLIRFVQWAKEMPCKVTIMDAISGEEFKSEQDPLIESIRRIIKEEINRKRNNLLDIIDEYGLYQFTKDAGLSYNDIYHRMGELPREVKIQYLKDVINDLEQTPGELDLTFITGSIPLYENDDWQMVYVEYLNNDDNVLRIHLTTFIDDNRDEYDSIHEDDIDNETLDILVTELSEKLQHKRM